MNRFLPAVILLLVLPAAVFSIRMPSVFFMDFRPDAVYHLVSDNNNTLEIKNSILIPEFTDEKLEVYPYLFMRWVLTFNFKGNKAVYLLNLKVTGDGNVYAVEIRDPAFDASLNEEVLVFGQSLLYNKPVAVSSTISLNYTRFIASLKLGSREFKDVLAADLIMGNMTNTVYLGREKNIVAIKTPDETFRQR